MWIKKPPQYLSESLDDQVNFLYNEDNVFIMDNHLAAGWSWLQRVDTNKSYNLIHVDRHYDLLDFPETIKTQIIDKNVDLEKLTFDEYLELEQPMGNGDSCPLFRWDNYILNLRLVYKNLFSKTYFATQDDDNRVDDFITKDVSLHELLYEIENWIEISQHKNWIVNLDIDYFFQNSNGGWMQTLTDKDIENLAERINRIRNRVTVITISLSPECSGGWQNSISKAKIICNTMNLNFHHDLLKYADI